MKVLFCFACLFAIVAAGSGAARAEVKLPALFADNMVLQQKASVPIWGWADDGEKVTIEFCGQKVTATAKDGRWTARLKDLAAGGPFEMTIAGKNTLTLKNVLVGEVWVCGGQSNMAFGVRSSEGAEEAIAASANPKIRLFKVAAAASDTPLDDVKATWQECGPETVPQFSATGYYFGRELQKALGVPVGLIESCVGGTNANSWMRRELLESSPTFKHILDEWAASQKDYPAAKAKYDAAVEAHKAAAAKAKAEGKQAPKAPRAPQGPEGQKRPGALYNGMIAPLQPYAIKGAIWYQGEANSRTVADAIEYRELLPAMIQCWRDDWKQGDFPFLIAQLPRYGAAGRSWPLLRESQLKTVETVKNAGLAITIDTGEEKNIHPKEKQPVGARLALAARAIAYGEKIVYSGPIYDAVKFDGAKAIVSFTHTGGGLEARGGELKGFMLAGDDGKFVAARAEIAHDKSGDTVVVSSPEVPAPKHVRYAWANWPECNLFNKEGLPAAPFRTDTLPIEAEPGAALAPGDEDEAPAAASPAPAAKARGKGGRKAAKSAAQAPDRAE